MTKVRKNTPDKTPKRVCPPLIGERAPAFDAQTTNGPIHFPTDYIGKWVILFSHAADFTPVCTSELIAFSRMIEDCRRLNTEIIGLSLNNLTSHLDWISAVREQIQIRGLKAVRLDFPLIADSARTIARRYGMIHPAFSESQTIRAVYFIDPNGIIRTILYYPITTGRNFKEMMRILIGLQTADRERALTPADWQPGDSVFSAQKSPR